MFGEKKKRGLHTKNITSYSRENMMLALKLMGCFAASAPGALFKVSSIMNSIELQNI